MSSCSTLRYDRARKYHWDGGYMSPRRYYPSPLGGYTYISAPQGSTFFYPNDWFVSKHICSKSAHPYPSSLLRYHKFKSIPLGRGYETIYPHLTTTHLDYDYLPSTALTHSDGLYERGPERFVSLTAVNSRNSLSQTFLILVQSDANVEQRPAGLFDAGPLLAGP